MRDLYHYIQYVTCFIMLIAWPVLLCSVHDLFHYAQCMTCINMLNVWPMSLCLVHDLYSYAQCVTCAQHWLWYILDVSGNKTCSGLVSEIYHHPWYYVGDVLYRVGEGEYTETWLLFALLCLPLPIWCTLWGCWTRKYMCGVSAWPLSQYRLCDTLDGCCEPDHT